MHGVDNFKVFRSEMHGVDNFKMFRSEMHGVDNFKMRMRYNISVTFLPLLPILI
jgi:hypothetical protein